MKRLSILLYVTFLALLAAPAQADIIYDNFGPGDSYQTIGWTVGSLFDFDQGNAFAVDSLGMDYYLETIELAVGLVSGPNELDVWLMTDSAGEPDTIIESFHFSDEMGSFGDLSPPLTANSLLNPLLEADEQYWLIASVSDPETWAAWYRNSTGDVGLTAQGDDPGTWGVSERTKGVFRVTGTPISVTPVSVSEPVTLLLLGSSLLGLAGFRRRFNRM